MEGRDLLEVGKKGFGLCIGSGFEFAILGMQDEDTVGVQREYELLQVVKMEVRGLRREALSRKLRKLHLGDLMITGVWMEWVKVIEEKASKLSILKVQI